MTASNFRAPLLAGLVALLTACAGPQVQETAEASPDAKVCVTGSRICRAVPAGSVSAASGDDLRKNGGAGTFTQGGNGVRDSSGHL